MLYMEFYNSIFCKCIKDKLINIKSVVKFGYRIFFSCSCYFFYKGIFYMGGGVGGGCGVWIEKLFYYFNKWVYDCDFYIYVVYKMCFNI